MERRDELIKAADKHLKGKSDKTSFKCENKNPLEKVLGYLAEGCVYLLSSHIPERYHTAQINFPNP